MPDVRRRELIALLGGAAVACPIAARAQREKPVLGFLHTATRDAGAGFVTAFRRGLSEIGYVDGQNVAIDYRWGNNQDERLPALAADLIDRRVALIVASPIRAALAAKASTTTIPIVFQIGGDPVKLGLVSSINRPGGNATGVNQLTFELAGKRLELLRELVPKVTTVGLIADPQASSHDEQMRDFQQAAIKLGLRTVVVDGRDVDSAFATFDSQTVDAIFLMASVYFYNVIDKVVLLAARNNIPVSYQSREFTVAGGLMSYGVDFADVYRQLGVYAGKILHGEKPADLPVLQPTKFELIINLKTAAALGLIVPPTLLATADEVIE